MPSLNWMLFIELPMAVLLVWVLLRSLASGKLTGLNDSRRASS